MLEDIRKYTVLFIVALVLIFVGLIFLGNSSNPAAASGGPTVVKTAYETFSQEDLFEDGDKYINIGQRLASNSIQNGSIQGYTDVFTYLSALGINPGGQATSDEMKRFLVNRANLKRALKEYGIFASKNETDLYQREVLFTGNDGVFDEQSYTEFRDKGLKGLGNLKDLNDYTADIITFNKFAEILSAGVVTDETAAEENFLSAAQTMTVTTLSKTLSEFKESISPSDEELMAFWNENRGRYLSEPMRKLTYFVAQTDFEKALAEKKAKLESGEIQKPVTDAAADAEKTPEELAAASEVTLTDQEREQAVNELGLELDENVWVILQQQVADGAKVAQIEPFAKDRGYEVKTTELIPVSELPANIRGAVRGANGRSVEQAVVDARAGTNDPMDALSEILGIGTDSWLLFRVDQSTEPSELPFEDAKEAVTADYVEEKAVEALLADTQKARDAVSEAIAGGDTNILEIAEKAGLQATEHLNLTAQSRIAGEPNVREVFRLAANTRSGEVSEVEVMFPLQDRAVFVYVQERQFVESDQNLAGLAQAGERLQEQLRALVIQHWFTAKYEEAEVELVPDRA